MSERYFDFLPRTTDILPAHDLCFGTPVNDQSAGIPLGDGDTGSLVWFENDGIHININKTDLWDLSSEESEYSASSTEEDLTCLRHGGELVIRFGCPCLDVIYQSDFEASLSLRDATLNLKAKTPFSDINAKCFASNKFGVTALKIWGEFEENQPISIALSRWGSRNFWRWYAQLKNDPHAGLGGTESFVEGDRIYITQKLRGTEFCVGLAIVGGEDFEGFRVNGNCGKFENRGMNKGEFTLYWNISCGKTIADARENSKAALDKAVALGFEEMKAAHDIEWEEFWNRSLVLIPRDYIENSFYLSLYYSNSECRGKYPPLFTSGIWGFRHDYYPWCYYFHYNMQHMYAPLEPSGHGELAQNYYAMRRGGLDKAKLYAKEVKKSEGAFYHDVSDFLGRGAMYDSENCTPGAQLAMAMYRHYRMSGDENFLRETVLPVMEAVGEYYLTLISKGCDGLWHISGTTAYEGTPLFDDTITDLVMIRVLFGTLAKYADGEKKEKYMDISENLPTYQTVPMDDDETDGNVFLLGIGKGKPVFGAGKVLSVGKNKNGEPVRKNFGDPAKEFYGFPDTEMSPLYPGGVFGLKDEGTELFDAMKNQILLHREPEKCMQWCMMPIYIARMGMGEMLWDYVESAISYWQVFPNGFCADCPAGISDVQSRLKYNRVHELSTGKNGEFEGYGFRHFDMEALPIVAMAACEALLQSYDGLIRICPAIGKDEDVAFCLYAEGGFKVGANICPESFYVCVESLRGEACKIVLPKWLKADELEISLWDGDKALEPKYSILSDERTIEVELAVGQCVCLSKGGKPKVYGIRSTNGDCKVCGNARLGSPTIPGKIVKEN